MFIARQLISGMLLLSVDLDALTVLAAVITLVSGIVLVVLVVRAWPDIQRLRADPSPERAG